MTKLLTILSLISQLMPTIIAMVKAVEEALPEKGQGSAKLALVRGALESAFENINGLAVTFIEIWPTLEKLIATIVATFNALGTFKK